MKRGGIGSTVAIRYNRRAKQILYNNFDDVFVRRKEDPTTHL